MAQVAMRSSDREWPQPPNYMTTTVNRQQQQQPLPPQQQQQFPPVNPQSIYFRNPSNYPRQPEQRPPTRGLRTALAAWSLPPPVVAAYASKGITQLFPWQAAALESGEDGHNLVYCAPTSGGKSLVADILMIRKMIGLGTKNKNNTSTAAGIDSALMPPPPPQQPQPRGLGRALVVLPYISIVSEKTEHLSHLLRPIKATVRGYYGAMDSSSSSPLAPNGESVAVCTIEKANVCINRLLKEGRLAELSCIVIDELHMIANPQRGVGVEMLLAKILHQKDVGGHIQIVGMSATSTCQLFFRYFLSLFESKFLLKNFFVSSLSLFLSFFLFLQWVVWKRYVNGFVLVFFSPITDLFLSPSTLFSTAQSMTR